MSQANSPHAGLTRRSFLKTTAAVAGAAAVAGVSTTFTAFAQEDAEAVAGEKVVKGRCIFGGCFDCERDYVIRDGYVVNTKPSETEIVGRRPCSRGYNAQYQPYNPNRVKYPMKRVGERGEEKWERISWDEAIQTITDKWKGYQKEFGPKSILVATSSGVTGIFAFGLYRLISLMGGVMTELSVDNASNLGYNRVYGSSLWRPSNGQWEHGIYDSKTIIIWGANVSEAYVQRFRHLVMAKRKGAKLYCIDPVQTHTARRSNKWIPIKPGSDAALILGLCNIIVEEGLQNTDFIMKETAGAYLVRQDTGKYLRMSDLGIAPTEGPADAYGQPTTINPYVVWDGTKGIAVEAGTATEPALEGSFEVDGIKVDTSYSLLVERFKEYPVEKVSEICDIPVEDIRELAHACTDGPVHHEEAYGAQCYDGGVQVGWALAILLGITGQYGMTSGAGTGTQALTPVVNWSEGYAGGVIPQFSVLKLREVVETGKYGGSSQALVSSSGNTASSSADSGDDYPIKALFISGASTLGGAANYNDVLEAIKQIEFVVTYALYYNDNCKWSDIILPGACHVEREEILFSTLDLAIAYTPQMMKPAFETKVPMDVWRLLAAGMNLDDKFDFTDDEWLTRCMLDTPYCKAAGITLEKLRETPTMYYNNPDCYLREGSSWNTPSKKLEFYFDSPETGMRIKTGVTLSEADLDHLPSFRPPREAWEGSEAMAKYPLICISNRARHRWHTDGFDSPWFKDLEPEPVIRVNKIDAEARGLVDGDLVELFNDRGHAVARMYIDSAVRPGMMVYPKGMETSNHIAGTFSELTSNYCNPVSVNTSFFDTCVEIRLWKGEE